MAKTIYQDESKGDHRLLSPRFIIKEEIFFLFRGEFCHFDKRKINFVFPIDNTNIKDDLLSSYRNFMEEDQSDLLSFSLWRK